VSYLEIRRHAMRVKPGPNLSQAGVTLARAIDQGIGPFRRVITSDIPRALQTAIAMGFAVDEQDPALAMMSGAAAAALAWDAGFGAFGRAVAQGGALAAAAQGLADRWRQLAETLSAEGAALLITHGGIIEAGAVAVFPEADHEQWGGYCDYCEGVRLHYAQGAWTAIEILRLDREAQQ
jgi:broad specificity phosphatase PhoE